MEKMEGCSSAGGVRKGAWTQEEDILLKHCIIKYGEGKWHLVPSRAGLNRCRKSCRLRWINYLKPDIKKGNFSVDEVDLILRLHKLLGNRWSLIAGRIPGRTANDVKNYWNTHLRKKQLLSYDNIKAKNDTDNYQKNITIKPTVIKPRPWTFKNQRIISTNPRPRSSAPTSEEGPQNCSKCNNHQWDGLLDVDTDAATYRYHDDDCDDHDGNFDLISEGNCNVVDRVVSLSDIEPLPAALGSSKNIGNIDDSVWDYSSLCINSSEFCVQDGLKSCWTDFIVDMDLWDVSADINELP